MARSPEGDRQCLLGAGRPWWNAVRLLKALVCYAGKRVRGLAGRRETAGGTMPTWSRPQSLVCRPRVEMRLLHVARACLLLPRSPCRLGVRVTCWLELAAERDSEDRSQDSWTGGDLAPRPSGDGRLHIVPSTAQVGEGPCPPTPHPRAGASGLFLPFAFLLVGPRCALCTGPFCLEASPLLGLLLLTVCHVYFVHIKPQGSEFPGKMRQSE